MNLCKYVQYKDMHYVLLKKVPTSEILTQPYIYLITYSTMDLISSFTLGTVLTLVYRRTEEFKAWVDSSPAFLTTWVIWKKKVTFLF